MEWGNVMRLGGCEMCKCSIPMDNGWFGKITADKWKEIYSLLFFLLLRVTCLRGLVCFPCGWAVLDELRNRVDGLNFILLGIQGGLLLCFIYLVR